MYNFLVMLFTAALHLAPRAVCSETLKRYAPDSWAPAWSKNTYIDVLSDILLSR